MWNEINKRAGGLTAGFFNMYAYPSYMKEAIV